MVYPFNIVAEAAGAAWRPAWMGPLWEWIEANVVVDPTSPMPGRWKLINSPWVADVLQELGNNRIRDVSIMCAAQSSKTQTLLCFLCYIITQDPGPCLWVMAARDEAKTFVRDRVQPTLDTCEPVMAELLQAPGLEYVFRRMSLYFTGAGSKSKLQSKPIRWLLLDEVRNYPKGALELVLKRTRSFWNSRRVVISTPDLANDGVHRAFLAGDQRKFHLACDGCQSYHLLKFEDLKWDRNDVTKPGQFWDFDELAKTIRHECPKCGFVTRDTPRERRLLAKRGKFIAANPKAPATRVSFHWNALLPPWVPWRSVVEEFLAARLAGRQGDREPLKTFVNDTLGEPWDDELGVVEDFGALQDRAGDYDFNDPWQDEVDRYMAADKQKAGGDHYWYVIRAYGRFGKSRLIAYGRVNSLLELEEIRVKFGVKAGNSVMDSGFRASEVYRFCVGSGWKAFKGDDAEYFVVREEDGRTVRRLWDATMVDADPGNVRPGAKRYLRLFRFSVPGFADLLAEYVQGLSGEWTLPKRIGRDYLKQMDAEERQEREDSHGRIRFIWFQRSKMNHLLDCERMLHACAVIRKLIGGRARILSPAPK